MILEKIYGNIGQGFKDLLISNDLKELSINKDFLTPLAVYKGNNRRFIYKKVDNFLIFVSSISTTKDNFNRKGIFLSHFILLPVQDNINTASYINSPSFIVNEDRIPEKLKGGKNTKFLKQSIKPFHGVFKEEVYKFIEVVLVSFPKKKKIILYVEDLKKANYLLQQTFTLLPRHLIQEISFSIGVDKFNEYNLCQVNILSEKSIVSIPEKINKNLIKIKLDEVKIASDYVDFLFNESASRIENLLFFLEKRKVTFDTIESSLKYYLIDIGEYPIKSERDFLDNIKSISSEDKLNKFLIKYFNTTIQITNKTMKDIDDIINIKYGLLKSQIYYKFLVKYTKEDYKYFLDKYRIHKEIFYYLACSYELDQESFLEELHFDFDDKLFNIIVDFNFERELYLIIKYELSKVSHWTRLPSRELQDEKQLFKKFFDMSSEMDTSRKISSYLFDLINNSSKKIELLLFVFKYSLHVLNNAHENQLLNLINEKILDMRPSNSGDVKYFIENVDLSSFKKYKNIKLFQVEYYFDSSTITHEKLNNILKILK